MGYILPATGTDPKTTTKQLLEALIDSAIAAIASTSVTGFVYAADTAAGLAATTDGEGFFVASSSQLIFYLNDGGSATQLSEVGTPLSQAQIDELLASYASILPGVSYTSHALLEAATVLAVMYRISYIDPDGKTRSLVRDPSGTAATTADGANWAPDGVGSPYDFGGVLDGDMNAVVTDATNEATVYAAFWTWLAAGAGRKGEWPNFRTMRVDSLVNGLSGDYGITGGIGSHIDGRNLPNLDASGTGSVLNHAGSVASTQSAASITATVDANGKDIVTVVTDAVHGLAVGDDIMLASDDAASSGGDTTNETRGQMSRVRSVTNTTTFIIQEPLYQRLPTNPVLIKFNWLENIDWDCHLVFVGPGRRSGSASNQSVIGYSGPEFVYGRNIRVKNMRTEYLDYQSIIFDSCVNYSTLNCSGIVDPVDDPGSVGAIQYFLTDKNGCARGCHSKWHSENYRHAYDHTGNSRRGVAHTLIVEDFYCVGTWRSAIAQHGNAFNSVIRNGKIENCYDGVDIRAPGWTVENIEMNHVRVMVSLSDNALSATIKGLRGKDVRRVVGLTDTNILLGTTEFGELNISDVIVDGCALTAIEIDATNIPVFTEADSAVSAGTTTSMTVGDLDLYAMVTDGAGGFDKFETITQASSGATAFVLNVSGSSVTLQRVTGTFNTTNLLTGSSSGASGKKPTSITTISNYNVTGMLTGVEITVDPDGGGAAVEVVRIASHVYDAGANTNRFSWTSAVGTAPTTSATYHIRTIIDGLSITDIDIRNCPTSVVRVFGNFRSPAITNITDNSDAVTTNPTIKLIADASNYCRNAEIRDWTARNKLGPDIDAANTGTRINGDFVDRSTAVEYIASGTIANDEVFRAGALQYIGETSATDISDMDAVVPFGDDISTGHFGGFTGLTDDKAVLLAAITHAAGRKVVGVNGETYAAGTTCTYTGTVNLDLSMCEWTGIANATAFNFSAETTASQLLSANYTIGASVIACNALARAPKAGDRVVIWSNAIDPANRQLFGRTNRYRCAELAVVGIGSTTTSIILQTPLRFTEGIVAPDSATTIVNPYTTALNCRVGIVHADSKCSIDLPKGGYVDGEASTPWTATAMRFKGYINPTFRGGSVNRGYGAAVETVGTWGAHFDHFETHNLENNTARDQYGYGFAGTGTGTIVTAYTSSNTRHAFTTTSAQQPEDISDVDDMLAAVRNVGAVVTGRAYGGDLTPWDTHQGATDTTFIDCYSDGCAGYAFSARGQNIKYVRPKSRNCTDGVKAGTEPGTVGGTLYWVAGDRQKDFTSVLVIDPDIECDGIVMSAGNATIEVSGRGVYTGRQFAVSRRGVVRVSGDHRALLSGEMGTGDTGIIDNSEVVPWATGDAVGFEQEGYMAIDGQSVTTDTGQPFGMMVDNLNYAKVRGLLRLTVPSGTTTLLSTTGTISSEFSGRVLYDVAGAADNTITENVTNHAGLSISAVDKTIVQKVFDAGSNSNGSWSIDENGMQTCTRIVNIDALTSTTAIGGIFTTAAIGDYAFPRAFEDVYMVNASFVGSDNSTVRGRFISAHLNRGNAPADLTDWNNLCVNTASSIAATAGQNTRLFLTAYGTARVAT